MPHYDLFTDGACLGNPGPGGWAYILRNHDADDELVEFGGEPHTTNNRMELTAVIEGLLRLPQPGEVHIHSDSQYVLNGLRDWMDGWKKRNWTRKGNNPVKNVELWKQLDHLRNRHDLHYHWIRGHTGHLENERCDRLATDAAKQLAR